MATKRAVIALLLVAAGGCALTADQLEALKGLRGVDETPEVQITIIINDDQVEVEQTDE